MKNLIYSFIVICMISICCQAQMSDSCSDGKILAIDITNTRYKCIIVPIVLDSVNVDLTNQTALIGSTILYTIPVNATGLYEVSWSATITRAASISSALGGTTGLQVIYTNADDNTVVTTTAGLNGALNILNIIGAPAYGVIIVYAKAGTNINYSFGYTSVGGTTMQYSIHARLKALQ